MLRGEKKRTIVLSTNTAWNVYNFRAGLVKAMVEQGYEVVVLAPYDAYAPQLRSLGCSYVELPMDNHGTNPLRDLLLLTRFARVLRRHKPVAFLGYTIKPNVYGSLAAHFLRIPVINNIAGLGATFIRTSHVTTVVRGLYRLALKRSHSVFFQNADDCDLFVSSGLVKPEICALVPGSGIDLGRFPFHGVEPVAGRPFRFLLVGRMLRDKGVVEFVDAARIVLKKHPQAVFQLLGGVNAGNGNAVPIDTIKQWEAEGIVQYLGTTDDVRPIVAASDCVVLPSYREGVPRSLLEAAAMGRPIVATDVVGCQDAVDDGVNGFLCNVRDPADLADKMIKMLELPHEKRAMLGEAGRKKVEQQFDEQFVIQSYLRALSTIPGAENSPGEARILPVQVP